MILFVSKMYVDYRYSKQNNPVLLAKEFEVSSHDFSRAAVIGVIVGAILCMTGALLMAFYQYDAAIFWSGLSVNIIGSTTFLYGAIYGIFYHFFVRCSAQLQQHQKRMFHHVKTKEAYLTLLEQDRGASYTFKLPKLRQEMEMHRTSEERRAVTEKDINRGMHCHLNGIPIPPDEVEKKYGSYIYGFVNQNIFSELACILASRYRNDHLTAYLIQVDGGSMKLNLIKEDGEQYLIVQLRSQFRIYTEKLEKYVKTTLKMNVRTGDAVMTWDSPQNDLPDF